MEAGKQLSLPQVYHQIGGDVFGFGTAVRRLNLQLICGLIASEFLSGAYHAVVEVDDEPISVLALQSINNPRVLVIVVVDRFRAEHEVAFKNGRKKFDISTFA